MCEIERLKRDSALKTDPLQHHKRWRLASEHNHDEAPTMSATCNEVQCCVVMERSRRKTVDANFLDN